MKPSLSAAQARGLALLGAIALYFSVTPTTLTNGMGESFFLLLLTSFLFSLVIGALSPFIEPASHRAQQGAGILLCFVALKTAGTVNEMTSFNQILGLLPAFGLLGLAMGLGYREGARDVGQKL